MESSNFWKNSFADLENPNVSRLVDSLNSMRTHAEELTSRIAKSLPGLTIHDITHLDALWEIAGIIAGDEFKLNPLEAYVFGGAVLLHDAGLCFDAYKGGLIAVRNTVQWRDAKARLELTGHFHNLDAEADFEALRTLHAAQAERLAVDPWEKEAGLQVFVIEDEELREHYGGLIGKVAASHHWDISRVAEAFCEVRPAPPFLDPHWTVDPLKTACLLRVADAGHIDGARAPSFFLKILQMNAVSRNHWVAQNHLGRLRVLEEDHSQLVVSSMSPFTRDESSAWWVAFDAIGLLDRELRDCNDLLQRVRSTRNISFPRCRVAGAGNVRELVRHVQTVGWEPNESSVHVSDVAALVSKLGGEQLYGKQADRLEIGLRELVQNATDAVIAREILSEDAYRGQVHLRLTQNSYGQYVLQVDDDGIGMSQVTLEKDLLDFGKSFWVSERAAQEFPGIHASGYSSIGTFGIGFFSVFMAASKVRVFSRRFDAAIDDVRCMSFEHGVSLRPILSTERPQDMGMGVSTRIELTLKPGVIDDPERIYIHNNQMHQSDLEVTFGDYVGALICGLSVPVFVEWPNNQTKVFPRFPPTLNERRNWLRRLSFASTGTNPTADTTINSHIDRLSEVRDSTRSYGLAAIRTTPPSQGFYVAAKSIGGLANPHRANIDNSFVGLLEYLPDSAQRNIGKLAAPKRCIDSWLTEQVIFLKKANVSAIDSIHASYSLVDFNFDPIDILQGIIVSDGNRVFFAPKENFLQMFRQGLRLLFPTLTISKTIIDQYFSNRVSNVPPNSLVYVPPRGGAFNDAELQEAMPKIEESLIGVIHRLLSNSGANPHWHVHKGTYQGRFEFGDYLEVTIS